MQPNQENNNYQSQNDNNKYNQEDKGSNMPSNDEMRTQPVDENNKVSSNVLIKRIIWYVAGFIIVLLVIRIILLLLGANKESSLVEIFYSITNVFALPFYGIFPSPEYDGKLYFDTASVLAIVVYALIAWGIGKLLTINKTN